MHHIAKLRQPNLTNSLVSRSQTLFFFVWGRERKFFRPNVKEEKVWLRETANS